ncbi:hypothetical protein ACTNBL_11790 [Enterococcus villorum]|jgi:hypothetical protein|uniref:Uncharacterized protein n=2 Tax=Enterococcus villorum TaxID=112904 RepID=A0A511J2A8_9ENTE|nr:hypothetical protein [Enterococcus villorum]EOH88888.1 hypothetical protein UAO_01994 [Enterococcus villorum ATCC 700913]EOW76525.1 hypothetical protein I591_01830 [Enterococcus villorum ATCC 700913]GEL92146.1 hypothetical protein EVI01_14830 [Enterococcus villorum]
MIKKILSSFIISTTLVAILMAVHFLVVLFSSPEPGKYLAYFKTMFFENITNPDGSITVSLGFTGEILPILISILLFTVFFTLTSTFHSILKERRSRLLGK